uniref:Uncharacterized protein n=1 Tax=Cacopsylla melanoneura TaxID=428564 RepID=A0A8D9BJG9_9HEMI
MKRLQNGKNCIEKWKEEATYNCSTLIIIPDTKKEINLKTAKLHSEMEGRRKKTNWNSEKERTEEERKQKKEATENVIRKEIVKKNEKRKMNMLINNPDSSFCQNNKPLPRE